jgi:hydroxycarboxylate dehydrogenase B
VIVIGHERLTQIVTRMIEGVGSTRAEAHAVAANLVEANLMGHDSHGVGLAPRYMLHAETGTMTPGAKASVITDSGVYLLLDGNMGYGQTVGREAMELAIAKVRSDGAAIVGLRNVHHLGRIGAWGEMCARAGFISIHYVNATGHRPYVAPWGGYEARYSTNPYCTAIPATASNPMIVLDMATSRVAQGKTRVAYYSGKQLMPEAVIGGDGKPTTDPKVIFEEPYGAMLPFGQHKGYGLAMICELLAGGLPGGGAARPELLSGDTIRNNMLTIVIDPKGFKPSHDFGSEIDQLVAYTRSAKPAEGFDKVRIAGDPERETMEVRRRDGIQVDDNTWAEMTRSGVKAGMDESEFKSNVKVV